MACFVIALSPPKVGGCVEGDEYRVASADITGLIQGVSSFGGSYLQSCPGCRPRMFPRAAPPAPHVLAIDSVTVDHPDLLIFQFPDIAFAKAWLADASSLPIRRDCWYDIYD